MKAIAIIGFAILTLCISAQNPNSLYGLENPTPGTINFVEYDLTSGNTFFLESTPLIGYSLPGTSACSDHINGLYHLGTGTEIYSFDMNGLSPMATTSIPVTGSALFINIEFDVCDSVFVGIHNLSPGNAWFSKFDPSSNTIIDLVQMPTGSLFLGGAMGEFDPNTRIYYLQTATAIFAINMDTGVILFNNPVQTLTGMMGAGHFSYDCQTQRLLGTIVGTNDEGFSGKFICVLDPATGSLSLLTNNPTSSGQLKPILGGSTYDHSTNQFYWSGAGGIIVGGDGIFGNMNFDQQYSVTGEVVLIESPTGCSCGLSTNVSSNGIEPHISIYPNPSNEVLIVNGFAPKTPYLIFDTSGNLIQQGTYESNGISVRRFSSGTYFLKSNHSAYPFIVQ